MSVTTKKSRVDETLTFSDKDFRLEIKYPHTDALIVHTVIGKFRLKKVLIDDGSGADIISYKAVSEMGIKSGMKPYKSNLFGFGGHPVRPKGRITLPVKLGDDKISRTVLIDF